MIKFLLFLTISSFCSFCFVLYKYKKLGGQKQKSSDNLKRIINAVNSVRYGNLGERIIAETEKDEYKNLIESINRMIETLSDREKMIKEYQKWLNEKNLSLETLIKKQEESKKLRKDFIATLGHDLKVPIIAESNALGFLVEGRFGNLDDKQAEVVRQMQKSNKELIDLVEILLETYKVEDNENLINLNTTTIDMNILIGEVTEEMKLVGASNEQNIELNLNAVPIVEVDPYQFKRVLKNLILNAFSYSQKKSNVIIESAQDENNIYIKIIDFGFGIEKDDIEYIFDKYYSAAKKFRKVGTGLGLYLSNQIVLAHGGKIDVESTPKEKTTFTIVLPIKNK